MHEKTITAYEERMTRITACVYAREARPDYAFRRRLEPYTGSVQIGRAFRQVIRPRRFGFPGTTADLQDLPLHIIRLTVPSEQAAHEAQALQERLDLNAPGRGSLVAQPVRSFRADPFPVRDPAEAAPPATPAGMVPDLALITAVLSDPGAGEPFARLALELGVGIPILSYGSGTGIRDRLGLLRITISPEKEIVHLVAPAHDADGLMRVLIEGAGINRPGGGFIYRTHVAYGMMDPWVRIGRQAHAASIEQIIAALDELKGGTGWRKRYCADPSTASSIGGMRRRQSEVAFECAEGASGPLLEAARQAGGGGATLTRVSGLSGEADGSVTARERVAMCMPEPIGLPVIEAVLRAAHEQAEPVYALQVADAPAAFSHRRPPTFPMPTLKP